MNWKTELNLYISCEGNSLVLIHLTRLLLERRIKLTVNALTSSILSIFTTCYFFTSHLSPTCNARDLGSIPGLERFPGEGNSYLLQYSGLENSIDCTIHGIAKNWTRLSDFHTHLFLTSLSHPQSHPHSLLFRLTRLRLWVGNHSWLQVFEKWNIVIFSKM